MDIKTVEEIIRKRPNLEETKIETLIVKQGELLILLESGHGYSILEEDTTVLEVKNGPYLGAEIDRRRI